MFKYIKFGIPFLTTLSVGLYNKKNVSLCSSPSDTIIIYETKYNTTKDIKIIRDTIVDNYNNKYNNVKFRYGICLPLAIKAAFEINRLNDNYEDNDLIKITTITDDIVKKAYKEVFEIDIAMASLIDYTFIEFIIVGAVSILGVIYDSRYLLIGAITSSLAILTLTAPINDVYYINKIKNNVKAIACDSIDFSKKNAIYLIAIKDYNTGHAMSLTIKNNIYYLYDSQVGLIKIKNKEDIISYIEYLKKNDDTFKAYELHIN